MSIDKLQRAVKSQVKVNTYTGTLDQGIENVKRKTEETYLFLLGLPALEPCLVMKFEFIINTPLEAAAKIAQHFHLLDKIELGQDKYLQTMADVVRDRDTKNQPQMEGQLTQKL